MAAALSTRRARPAVASLLAVLAALAAAGCATGTRRPAFNLKPAEWKAEVEALGLDPALVVSPVQATPEMRHAALQYAGAGTGTERLERLHTALLDRKDFAFEYEKVKTFTAEEAFSARRGNCVSFTNLLIAFSRSLGIPLQAGLLVTRGSAEKSGDLIVVYSHMVAVHPVARKLDIYDFYRDRLDAPGDLRLLDDLEIAAIALSNRGVAALQAGDLATARTELERAVRLGPSLPDMHSNLGIVLWRQGDVDAALATFRRGLELDPHRAALLHNLAGLYLQLGKTAEARAALSAASLGQASPFMLVVKGDLEFAGGDLRGALRTYRKAHSRDRTVLPPLLGIARVERALGNPEGARKALEKARKLAPDDEQVQELLSTL